jgi:hypothetical protein
MTSPIPSDSRRRDLRRKSQTKPTRSLRVHKWFAISAAVAVMALAVVAAIAPPPPPTQAAKLKAYVSAHSQTVTVSDDVAVQDVQRDGYSATPGYSTLAAGATNADWAKLILIDGKWPMSSSNVTVILRWMRQENGPPNWWNRNNPLNNGLGSGGASGTGSYPNLVVAASYVAKNLHRPMFATIASALAKSESTKSVEKAIWASPWSTSHYMNGTHWSDAPVPSVKAPDSAWG